MILTNLTACADMDGGAGEEENGEDLEKIEDLEEADKDRENKEDQDRKDKEGKDEEEDKKDEEEEVEARIRKLMAGMSLEEKIGQLVISGFEGEDMTPGLQSLIQDYKLGGFIFFSRNIKDIEQTKNLINSIKEENKSNQIPLFLSIDEEGGRVSRLPSDYHRLPSGLDIGAKENEELARSLGVILGHRLGSLGFNLNFAPVLDIYSNPENTVIGDRAYGRTVELVQQTGLNVIRGMRSTNIIPVAKHFPGHGDTHMDSHLDLPSLDKSLEELKSFEILPFQRAIKEGIEMIMLAHILYPNIDGNKPASMSPVIIQDLLRKDLAYEGIIISDDMTMGAIVNNYSIEDAAIEFLQAGGDILLLCHGEANTIGTIEEIKKTIEEGDISMERIDKKVYKVLSLKDRYKLEDKKVQDLDLDKLKEETGEFLKHFK